MVINAQLKGGLALRQKWISIRNETLKQADKEFNIFKNNPEFTFGLGLYLAEGTKTSTVSVVNLDYRALKIFVDWCKKWLNGKKFSARLRIAPDMDESKAKKWWKNRLGIKPKWSKTQFMSITGKTSSEYANQYGLCRVTLIDCIYAREKVMRWIDLYCQR